MSRTSFIASISIAMDSFSEMLATRSMLGDTEPSFISGMNDVPSSGTSASAATNAAPATPTVRTGLRSARCSSFR